MTTPNVRDNLKIPGRLSMNPTDLGAVYPHGGTPLGVCEEIVVRPEARYQFVTAEEYGGERVEGSVTYEGIVLAAVLKSYDLDMISKVFPNASAGSVSGKVALAAPGSVRTGARLSDRSCVLCFTPDDEDRHPMLIVRRAIPAVEESAQLTLRIDESWALGVVFYGIRDSSSRLYSYGLRRDLSL